MLGLRGKMQLSIWRKSIKKEAMLSLNRQRFFMLAQLSAVLIFTGACSKEKVAAKEFYFAGPCKVSVKTVPAGAEIFVDGISVGDGIASVEIPCGEKQIMAKKAGYVTHKSYEVVAKGSSLAVEVTLKPSPKHAENFALSDDFIGQIDEGQPIHLPGEEAKELAEGQYPAYMSDMNSLLAAVKGETGSDAGGSEMILETGPWTSVDDWR